MAICDTNHHAATVVDPNLRAGGGSDAAGPKVMDYRFGQRRIKALMIMHIKPFHIYQHRGCFVAVKKCLRPLCMQRTQRLMPEAEQLLNATQCFPLYNHV